MRFVLPITLLVIAAADPSTADVRDAWRRLTDVDADEDDSEERELLGSYTTGSYDDDTDLITTISPTANPTPAPTAGGVLRMDIVAEGKVCNLGVQEKANL